ncbi:hypothetical protein BGZ63DRAFT_380255 [Mariannaea sp. PMI_226]|nr:hypothetical protein BGZ63DRAFT_380255 [Mariannaea sp. PMI_226]
MAVGDPPGLGAEILREPPRPVCYTMAWDGPREMVRCEMINGPSRVSIVGVFAPGVSRTGCGRLFSAY